MLQTYGSFGLMDGTELHWLNEVFEFVLGKNIVYLVKLLP